VSKILTHVGVAEVREADVVELQVGAARFPELADRLAPGRGGVDPELREVGIDPARDRAAPGAEVERPRRGHTELRRPFRRRLEEGEVVNHDRLRAAQPARY